MKNQKITERALIVGYNGGVGQAVLSLLQHSQPGRQLRDRFETIFLLDKNPAASVDLANAKILEPMVIDSAETLARLIRTHGITQVVDFSSIDTVDCASVCDREGADFLCTSVEEWPGHGTMPTDEAIARLFPPRRPELKQRSHLIGSGANPGIVNAMVYAALEEFARRTGAQPTTEDLDLHSILITEVDTTTEIGAKYPDNVFAITWSPAHCLEELFERRSFSVRNGRSIDLGHRPIECWYQARCGDQLIEGMAVPHEETVTLARKFSNVEIAFIYRVPEAARVALGARSYRVPIEKWPTRRLHPPTTSKIEGFDRVGVLLCSRKYGELWMGFETNVSKGLELGTNATQLQVAAGVLAGWHQLGRVKGIHFVEDLDWREFLEISAEVLGSPIVVHDPDAPYLPLSERAQSRSGAQPVAIGAK